MRRRRVGVAVAGVLSLAGVVGVCHSAAAGELLGVDGPQSSVSSSPSSQSPSASASQTSPSPSGTSTSSTPSASAAALPAGSAVAGQVPVWGQTVVSTSVVPFTTRVVEDSALPAGVTVIVTAGHDGVMTFYRAQGSVPGTSGSRTDTVPVFSSVETTLPTEQVVRKGTNTTVIPAVSPEAVALQAKVDADAAAAAAAAAVAQAAAQQAASAAVANQQAHASDTASTSTSTDTASVSDGQTSTQVTGETASQLGSSTSVADNIAYAKQMLSSTDFSCLNTIAMVESGWETTATNPSSGAYGVGQSLPAQKMSAAGADWQTNGKTQINWMITYADERYGSVCQAATARLKQGWY